VQSAFNIANSIGAYLGGLAIATGGGPTSPALVGTILTCVGLALALVSGVLDRKAAHQDAALATDELEPLLPT
jgi:DHA1 family inner membrane transport protein